jgi:hypothetical protein
MISHDELQRKTVGASCIVKFKDQQRRGTITGVHPMSFEASTLEQAVALGEFTVCLQDGQTLDGSGWMLSVIQFLWGTTNEDREASFSSGSNALRSRSPPQNP